jgi:hypothetical protein
LRTDSCGTRRFGRQDRSPPREILRLERTISLPARTALPPAGSFMSFQIPATPTSMSGRCCSPHQARASGD